MRFSAQQINFTFGPRVDGGTRIFAHRGSLVIRGNRADSIYHGPPAVISYNYEVPFKDNGALRYLVDAWFTAGVISFQSGVLETIYIGGYDNNGDGEAYNDRPNWGNRNAAINHSQTCMADPTCHWRCLSAC